MSSLRFESSAALYPSKTAQSKKKLVPVTGKAIQPFRFLDLPPEIRETIYDLWIPSVLHVSLGCRGIRLGYFMEAFGSISFQTLSCTHLFFLNRQFYDEFCHALFTRSTWCFSSTNLLVKAFKRLPKPTRDRIRHVSMRLTGQFVEQPSIPSTSSDDGLSLVGFQTAQRHLRQMKELQTLVFSINLVDFGCRSNLTRTINKDPAIVLAANCVADFTWEGVETRVPFVQSALPEEFVEMLRRRCGEANVSLVLKHKERYAGQMVDVVISQCAVST